MFGSCNLSCYILWSSDARIPALFFQAAQTRSMNPTGSRQPLSGWSMVSPPFLIRVMDGPIPVRFRSGGLTGTTTKLLFHFSYSNREHAMSRFHSLVSLDLFRRYLRLNPRVTKIGGKEEYVSLNLMLAQPSVISGMVVEASFKFLMYDQLYGKHHEQHQGTLANYFWKNSGYFTFTFIL